MARRRQPWEPNPDTILEDLVALANGRRRRTDSQTLAQIEAWKAGRRAAAKRRRDIAQAERIAAMEIDQARKTKALAATGKIRDRILQAMDDGLWYGAREVLRAIGLGREPKAVLTVELLRAGMVRRQANPAWDPRPVSPQKIAAGAIREPKWLFQITESGALARQNSKA